jgi:hypothetical protein
MRKILFSLALVAGMATMNAQSVLFYDDFEEYEDFAIDGIGDWTLIDVDGLGTYSGGGGEFPNQFDPKSFMVFNMFMAGVTNSDGSDGEERYFDPIDGFDKYMGAWASNGAANNDWMISPAITLGAGGNTLEFVHKSLSSSYGYEKFNVLIYAGTGTPSPADFTALDTNLTSNSWQSWLTYTKNLDAYAGQTVRIAIQCVSNDAYMFMVDNFKVTADETAGVADLNKATSTVYPNPVVESFNVNLSAKFNSSDVKVTITDMTGKEVKSFGAASSYNVSDLAAGVYVVKITDGKNTETKKIVKK